MPAIPFVNAPPLATFSMWGTNDATMAGTMRHMWSKGGFKPFFAAYRVTAVREGATSPFFFILPSIFFFILHRQSAW
jgi:hypothetical protein